MIRLSSLRKILLLLLFLVFLGGCGYGFRDYGSGYTVPKDLKTVAIASFANRTYESLVPNYLKNALVAEFARSKRLAVVVDPGAADLVISGAVLEISDTSISYSSDDRTYEYRVQIKIAVQARDNRRGQVIWQNGGMWEVDEYHTTGEPHEVQVRKRQAMENICLVLAENIHDRLLADF